MADSLPNRASPASAAVLASKVGSYVATRGDEPECETDLPGLVALARRRISRFEPMLYQPSFCLILRGSKAVQLGERELVFRTGDSVIISHSLPVLAKITEASEAEPFVALALEIDLGLVRELRQEVGEPQLEQEQARYLEVGRAETALVEAMARLFELVDRPLDARVLGPLVRREIHYRLLLAPQGRTLRQLLVHHSHASQIRRAIAVLRQNLAEPISVGELARVAGMSSSSFHEHFKTLTATSPLQYQKNLRLMEARRLLADGEHNVTEVALEVGYQSPTQFSREYSRRFGHPPRHDLPSR